MQFSAPPITAMRAAAPPAVEYHFNERDLQEARTKVQESFFRYVYPNSNPCIASFTKPGVSLAIAKELESLGWRVVEQYDRIWCFMPETAPTLTTAIPRGWKAEHAAISVFQKSNASAQEVYEEHRRRIEEAVSNMRRICTYEIEETQPYPPIVIEWFKEALSQGGHTVSAVKQVPGEEIGDSYRGQIINVLYIERR